LRTRDPFGEVLEGLRLRIRRGDIAPGAPLIVLDLAADLGVSATPVREALAYLAGEGLVEGRQGPLRGYLAGRPGPGDLADLLRLHQALVTMAMAGAAQGGLAGPNSEDDGGARRPPELDRVARTEALFAAIVDRGGGGVLQRAHRLVADRLHLVRRREGQVLTGLEAELAGLDGADGSPVAAAIRTYHRRRVAAAARLAALLV
jgi:DNA-binding transcriptional MocR family regulator